MARPLAVLIAALAVTLLALPAEAQWKWRDKGGRVQYSDLPPPNGTPEQDILSRPGAQQRRTGIASPAAASAASAAGPLVATAASAPLAPRGADPELDARRKKAESDQAAKQKADEEKVAVAKAENCSRAKGQMKTLESGIRIARANAQGEREFLDDKQRGDEMKRTRDVIATDCK